VEMHPDNNEICSRVLRQKGSRSSVVENRERLVSGGGISRKIYIPPVGNSFGVVIDGGGDVNRRGRLVLGH